MDKLTTDYHTIRDCMNENEYWDAGPDAVRIMARGAAYIFKALDIESVDETTMQDVISEIRALYNDVTNAVLLATQKAIREL